MHVKTRKYHLFRKRGRVNGIGQIILLNTNISIKAKVNAHTHH